jgi:hypothetical protein
MNEHRGTLKIPADIKAEIKIQCARHGMTAGELIREMWHLWKEKKLANQGLNEADEPVLPIYDEDAS